MLRQDGPSGVVVVDSLGKLGAARLFGLPFVLAGLYFLYYISVGLFGGGGLTIAGWILLPLMAAAFLVPGWLLLVVRKRVRLDGAARQAVEEWDFLIYTHRKRSEVATDAHVMLRLQRGARRHVRGPVFTHTRQGFLIHVYLVTRKQQILLALFDEDAESKAHDLARRAAAVFAIRVQDRIVRGGEITQGGVVVERLGEGDADPP